MTLTIPAWLLWIAGGLGLVVLVVLAFVGVVFLWTLKDWRWK